MITYKTLSVAEAFQKASLDATWNETERAALADIARGLEDSGWNQAYMAGEVQKDGKDWDGTEEDLRPIVGGIQRTARWRAIGYGRAWAKAHKAQFLVREATGGWNIGRLYFPDLSDVKEALKRVTSGGYAIDIVTEEGDLTKTEVSIWYEDGKILGRGRVSQKGAVPSVDCFDPAPEPLSDDFLLEHAEAIVRECATAPWM